MKKIIIVHDSLAKIKDYFYAKCLDTDKSVQMQWSVEGGMDDILKYIQLNKETLYEEEKK